MNEIKNAITYWKQFMKESKQLKLQSYDKKEKDMLNEQIIICKTTIKALEKQIKEKPFQTSDDNITNYCPNCEKEIELQDTYYPYCRCGQALDWS